MLLKTPSLWRLRHTDLGLWQANGCVHMCVCVYPVTLNETVYSSLCCMYYTMYSLLWSSLHRLCSYNIWDIEHCHDMFRVRASIFDWVKIMNNVCSHFSFDSWSRWEQLQTVCTCTVFVWTAGKQNEAFHQKDPRSVVTKPPATESFHSMIFFFL